MSHNAKVQVSPTLSSLIQVTATETQVEVKKPLTSVVTLTAQGPQGPPFVGSVLFDTNAIEALGAGDLGKVLEWDGARFIPTNELENDLTLYGGSF